MGAMLEKVKKGFPQADFNLIIFIFFLIFSPPIIPQINTALFATAYAGIMIVFKYRKDMFEAVKDCGMLKFGIAMAIFFVYVAVITIINYFAIGEHVQLMHYIKLWYRFFMIVPVLMICALYICLRAKEKKFDLYNLAMSFVYATMIQFVFVLAALVFPAVKTFFISIMYANTGDVYLNIPWVMARRGFGFVNTFVDSFGFGMGIIGALPLFFIKENRLKIIYFVPCLILVSFVNVRTGLIVAAIGLLASLPIIFGEFKKMNSDNKKKSVLTVVIAGLILAMFIGLVYVCNPVTINWVIGDMTDMVETIVPGTEDLLPDVETDAETTTAEVLFSDRFWNIPLGWNLIFGSGHTIYGADGYPNSDVGYVNDLWLGGIVGCILLYGAFAILLVTAFKSSKDRVSKLLVIFLACSILVFQIKANAIMFNAGLNTMLTLLFFVCYHNRKEEVECNQLN